MQKNTMKTVRLELDAAMLSRLEKLCDFHGEEVEETIRICIRHEWNSYRMEPQRRNPEPEEPAGDDLIPH